MDLVFQNSSEPIRLPQHHWTSQYMLTVSYLQNFAASCVSTSSRTWPACRQDQHTHKQSRNSRSVFDSVLSTLGWPCTAPRGLHIKPAGRIWHIFTNAQSAHVRPELKLQQQQQQQQRDANARSLFWLFFNVFRFKVSIILFCSMCEP